MFVFNLKITEYLITRYTSIDISLKNVAPAPRGLAYIYLVLLPVKSFIWYRLGHRAFSFFYLPRFCWDCKGRNIFYSCQIYFEVFFEGNVNTLLLTNSSLLLPSKPSNNNPHLLRCGLQRYAFQLHYTILIRN